MADDDLKGRETAKAASTPHARRPYARPQVAWREAYEPVAFGVSCAKEPGNPPCVGFYSA